MRGGLGACRRGVDRLRKEVRRYLHCYLFILPFYAFFAIFKALPFLYSIYVSFCDWRGVGTPSWVGLNNYRILLLDPRFRTALWNTVYIWVGHIVPLIAVSLVVAAILNSPRIKGYKVLRGIYFLPSITSVVIVGLVFASLLGTEYGVVNLLITRLGGEKVKWLTSARWSKNAIILMILWQWTGYFTVLMLAGLQAIPKELYEAASVDGATPVQAFLHITLPLTAPVIVFVAVTSTFNSFQSFAEPYVLTGGGPGGSSTTAGLYLYSTVFSFFKFGYASAMAYVTGLSALVLGYVQWRFAQTYFIAQ